MWVFRKLISEYNFEKVAVSLRDYIVQKQTKKHVETM